LQIEAGTAAESEQPGLSSLKEPGAISGGLVDQLEEAAEALPEEGAVEDMDAR
jgi:hypothetical protein